MRSMAIAWTGVGSTKFAARSASASQGLTRWPPKRRGLTSAAESSTSNGWVEGRIAKLLNLCSDGAGQLRGIGYVDGRIAKLLNLCSASAGQLRGSGLRDSMRDNPGRDDMSRRRRRGERT